MDVKFTVAQSEIIVDFSRNSEIFWKIGDGGKIVLISNYRRTIQQRLWLQFSHKG